jgi:hypothetical protein
MLCGFLPPGQAKETPTSAASSSATGCDRSISGRHSRQRQDHLTFGRSRVMPAADQACLTARGADPNRRGGEACGSAKRRHVGSPGSPPIEASPLHSRAGRQRLDPKRSCGPLRRALADRRRRDRRLRGAGTLASQECDRRAAGAVQRSRAAEFGRTRKPAAGECRPDSALAFPECAPAPRQPDRHDAGRVPSAGSERPAQGPDKTKASIGPGPC